MFRSLVATMLVFCLGASALGDEETFVPLFNGRDLAGWVPVNVAPGTFTVRDGMIVSTGVPTGVMRTERQYENFVIEMEWKHIKPGGNAGLFVWSDPLTSPGVPFTRSIEVQILDGHNSDVATSHGDVFAIHGAKMTPDRPHPKGWDRCLPSESRCKPAGEWNHYRVECNNGILKLAVNGKVVSGGSACDPRKGYICLESEGSECHFRNIRIHELPSTKVAAEQSAPLAEPFKPLYSGLDLSGWRDEASHAGHWKPADWILEYDGQSPGAEKNLWTQKEYTNFVLIADWRLMDQPKPTIWPIILANGDVARGPDGKRKTAEVLDAGDTGIYLRGDKRAEVNISCQPVGSGELYHVRVDNKLPAEARAGATPKLRADNPPGDWNRFVITMRGDRVSVRLNGKSVIENASIPGVAAKGAIGLQHHPHHLQFANLYIMELGPDR